MSLFPVRGSRWDGCSGRVQWARCKCLLTIGAASQAPKKENTMLTKFAAALLATSLIAGSALAAQPSGTPASNAAPAVQTQTPSTPAAKATKPAKRVKHTARHRNHVRQHVARSKDHAVHHARHASTSRRIRPA